MDSKTTQMKKGIVELVQQEELLKAETKRVIMKISQTNMEIANVKNLIAQVKENTKHKTEEPTEVHE